MLQDSIKAFLREHKVVGFFKKQPEIFTQTQR